MDKVYNWGAIDGGIILKEILLSKSSVAIFLLVLVIIVTEINL